MLSTSLFPSNFGASPSSLPPKNQTKLLKPLHERTMHLQTDVSDARRAALLERRTINTESSLQRPGMGKKEDSTTPTASGSSDNSLQKTLFPNHTQRLHRSATRREVSLYTLRGCKKRMSAPRLWRGEKSMILPPCGYKVYQALMLGRSTHFIYVSVVRCITPQNYSIRHHHIQAREESAHGTS